MEKKSKSDESGKEKFLYYIAIVFAVLVFLYVYGLVLTGMGIF